MAIETTTDYKQLIAAIRKTKRDRKKYRKYVPTFAAIDKQRQIKARLQSVVAGVHWFYNNGFLPVDYYKIHIKKHYYNPVAQTTIDELPF